VRLEARELDGRPGPCDDLGVPPLATRSARLMAALIDVLIAWLGPVALMLYGDSLRFKPADDDPTTSMAGLLMFGWLLLVGAYNAWMLATRGQTPGKNLLRIRIVRLDGSPASPAQTVLLRAVLVLLLDLVPGFLLLDPLFILRKDRRCLHDLIAGTQVVVAPRA
jgi:uncharacterized RDD family membrane protein YckC